MPKTRQGLSKRLRPRRPTLLAWLVLASGLVSLSVWGALLIYLVQAFR
ncbi:hypothetical protein [Microvirga massiliensis]|nr:hypothetical protein [Microvirga massiliensis]